MDYYFSKLKEFNFLYSQISLSFKRFTQPSDSQTINYSYSSMYFLSQNIKLQVNMICNDEIIHY